MKKLALTLSVLAASTMPAHAELAPMSDFELEQSTGQAGVDIELDIAIDIGQIKYTDTATNGDGDGGSLGFNNIFIGGGEGRDSLIDIANPGNTSRIDNFALVIDIEQNGDMKIAGTPLAGGGGIGIVDLLITGGDISLYNSQSEKTATLVDSWSIYGGAAGLDTTIRNDNSINFLFNMSIDDLDVDLSSSLGVNIQNAVVRGSTWNRTGSIPFLKTFIVEMDMIATTSGLQLNFVDTTGLSNKFDVLLPSIEVGGANIGEVWVDDFALNGVSLNIAGRQ